MKNGERFEAAGIPPLYHSLKAVAHIPLAIYVTLYADAIVGADAAASLTDNQIAELKHYRELIIASKASINETKFPANLFERQTKIINLSVQLLDQIIETKIIKDSVLTEFARQSAPLILANSADAAKAELDTLHRQITAWRNTLAPTEWQQLHVVVIGAHMPREGALVMQYFSRLLGEAEEGHRIIYAESLDEEKPSLNLLAMHLLNAKAAAAFFNDKDRLHRDLFADAAKEYLKQMDIKP